MLLAYGGRLVCERLTPAATAAVLHAGELRRVAAVGVDMLSAAAIAALHLSSIGRVWLPVAIISTIGGGATLVACLWLCRRAFPHAPFEHAVTLYGAVTGTLAVGLTLLRTVDHELMSGAAVHATLGQALTVVLNAPMALIVLPLALHTSAGQPAAVARICALLVLQLAITLGLWWRAGPLRLRPLPWAHIWPSGPATSDSRPAPLL